MVTSHLVWTSCLAIAAAGCCLGSILALTTRKSLSILVLAVSLTAMALGAAAHAHLFDRPDTASPAAPIVADSPLVTVTIPGPTDQIELPAPARNTPIPIDLSPPPLPQPGPQESRPAPQETSSPPESVLPLQAMLLGTAAPSSVTLLVLCSGPIWQRRRRRRSDRQQWRAIHELTHLLEAEMNAPGIARLRVEEPQRYAHLLALRERAVTLLEPQPPRYPTQHIALTDLAGPQAVYAWAAQVDAVRRDLSER